MPEHDHYDDHDLFNAETHHESSDVPIRPLWWAIGIFIVFAIVTHIVLGFMYKGFVAAERKRMDPPETTVARPANADVPQNQPLLQPFPQTGGDGTAIPPQASTPVTDMHAMRAQEEAVLDHYGWVDRQHGIVRLPIEKAKAVMAARLAVEGQIGTAPAAVAAPGTDPSPTDTPVLDDSGFLPSATTTTQIPATGTGGGQQ